MADVQRMGQKRDRNNRVRLARKDDKARQTQVSVARKFIYEKQYSIVSEVVEARLSEGSLVPSEVGSVISPVDTLTHVVMKPECLLT